MKGVLDYIELRMLKRVEYMRERSLLKETHTQSRMEHSQ